MKKIYIITVGLILVGIILFGARIVSPDYIDSQGILHEQFYLTGLGTLSFLIGVVTTVINALVIKLKK